MARQPKPSGENVSGEYAKFSDALKKVLSASQSEIKAKIKSAKRKRVSKTPSVSHA
jgi:hypothetical protein